MPSSRISRALRLWQAGLFIAWVTASDWKLSATAAQTGNRAMAAGSR